jgi:hypothetical protein
MKTNFFSPLSFVAVYGSGMGKNKKIRIRYKHPGSATLVLEGSLLFLCALLILCITVVPCREN